ncbi:MAG: citrate lyase subunit beta [Rhodothalassiaceae bacterium]|nr:MAG: citrate lyase subunit beta [Rhodothalassiaceae bacterium]
MTDHAPAIRPRRSVLYMPGINTRAMEKAKTLDCDGVILDLEDAVAPQDKEEARRRVAEAVTAGGFGHREIAIRVNRLDTPWGRDDVAAAVAAGPDALLLPKVESAAELDELAALAARHGGADIPLWAMIETPRGVFAAPEIAAHPRLAVLVMGTSDLAKELNARHVPGRTPFLYALERCMLAARAAGRAILDGVFLDLADEEGLAAECRQGRELGFDGKTLIHPKQIAAANAAFAPSAAEVEEARAVIAAYEEALAAGRGVAVLNGRLVENLHVDMARRTLALHDAITRR